MSNWIINELTVVGDVATIKRMVETHFQVEPAASDPDRLSDIVVFDKDAKPDDYRAWGFNLMMGPTDDHAHGGRLDKRPAWYSEYSSPFYLEWCSKWTPAATGVENSVRDFPELSMDYLYYGMCGERAGRVRIRPGEPIVNDFDALFWPESNRHIEESIERMEECIRANDENRVAYRVRALTDGREPDGAFYENLRSADVARLESLKSWDASTRHLAARYYYTRNEDFPKVEAWLATITSGSNVLHYDEHGYNEAFYLALDADDAARFAARWKDRISLIER